jgi:spore coat polysaccharide biosynthesis predicted glycosyltransferase SpsG
LSDAPRILFHTSGDHAIGLGHVVRCLALADALREEAPGCRPTFRPEGAAEAVVRLVEAAGYSLGPAPEPEALVVDVPATDPSLFREFAGVKVSIDDPGPARFEADLAFAMLYEPRAARPAGSRTVDLRGLPYVILKTEFRGIPLKPIAARAENILICQGGSDTYGMTPRICSALRALEGNPEIHVVLGPAFLHEEELVRALGEDRRFHIHRNLPSLWPRMVAADLCVSAAGMTSLELAAAGVPMILVVTEAKEAETASLLQRDGAALFPGGPERVADGTLLREVRGLLEDARRREALSRTAQQRVDGRGAVRVATAILGAIQRRRAGA